MDDNVNEQIKNELIKNINQSLSDYRKLNMIMYGDAPLETLCLSKRTINLLNNRGINRIYDLLGLDLVKIEGFTDAMVGDLASRFNEFFSMCG
jgi:hypothetical protein